MYGPPLPSLRAPFARILTHTHTPKTDLLDDFASATAMGIPDCQVAWLGLSAGRKLWLVAPPHEPRPPIPLCGDYGRERKTATRQCVLMPGEIIRLPLNWWHASVDQEDTFPLSAFHDVTT